MATWLGYSKLFGTSKENIYDPLLQERVARYLLDRGESHHWANCARKTEAKLGPYP